jgi:hypothetical protein
MKTNVRRSLVSLMALALIAVAAGSAWALMPPHVTGTNIKDGVLDGKVLTIRGYSLGYSDLKSDLSLLRTTNGQAVKHTRKLTCTMEGDCKSDRPGSCQERCELKLTLVEVKNGESFNVTFLDLKKTFDVALKRAKSTRDGTN